MAGRTLRASMCAGQWEWRCAVIEARTRPGTRIVAVRALLRESCLRVIRVGHAVVIGQMTGRARCREARIHIILVAGRTLHPGMRASQWEWCRAVIKCCSRPGCRAVTC